MIHNTQQDGFVVVALLIHVLYCDFAVYLELDCCKPSRCWRWIGWNLQDVVCISNDSFPLFYYRSVSRNLFTTTVFHVLTCTFRYVGIILYINPLKDWSDVVFIMALLSVFMINKQDEVDHVFIARQLKRISAEPEVYLVHMGCRTVVKSICIIQVI